MQFLIRTWFVAAVICAGCTTSSRGSNGDAGAQGAMSCPRNGTVPPDLRDVERSGEGLVSATFAEYPARTPDWARASTVYSLLTNVWDKTKAQCPDLPATEVEALDAAVTTLKSAISAQ